MNRYYLRAVVLLIGTLIATSFFGDPSLAHGALAIDDDKCVLSIGNFAIHFAGYQPEIAKTAEFCEDIPETGKTVVVLDFVHDELRQVPVEVLLVPAGEGDDLSRSPVLHVQPNVYPTGTLSFSKSFTEPGDYVGIVTAGEKREAIAKFPFSVGKGRGYKDRPVWHYIFGALLAIGLILGLLFRTINNQNKARLKLAPRR